MSLDEATWAIASEGFPHVTETLDNVLRTASCLLADGLDETDPNRSYIADRLRSWALAHPDRRLVLTTRPVGHNPAWFDGWEHCELLPLGSSDVSELAETIFNIKGAEYLLRENAPACYLDIVKEKCRNAKCTMKTFEDLLEILSAHLPIE